MSEKERRTVRVDLQTFTVYPDKDGGNANRIGTVLEYVRNEGARIRTGKGVSGAFTSHRITVKFNGPDSDGRPWVGQIKNTEMDKATNRKTVILRPVPETVEEMVG